jgi:hypothetical protein
MLTHLYTSYGRLTPADLQDNNTRFRKPYDPNQPIEALFDQIEEDFYLNTPLKRYKYMRLPIAMIPDEIIQQYQLQ